MPLPSWASRRQDIVHDESSRSTLPLPDKLKVTALDFHIANSTKFLLRTVESAWSDGAIGMLLLVLLAGTVFFLMKRVWRALPGRSLSLKSTSAAPWYDENGARTRTPAAIEDMRGRTRINNELQEKSAILGTVNHALNTFLDSGDWSAASRHLLSFALRQTQSEYGFLGVVLDGPVLRVLVHSGIVWDEIENRELYESKMKHYEECGYFELEHQQTMLGEVMLKAKTVVSNNPAGDARSKGLPKGHPLL